MDYYKMNKHLKRYNKLRYNRRYFKMYNKSNKTFILKIQY